jgi:hypothetical protein
MFRATMPASEVDWQAEGKSPEMTAFMKERERNAPPGVFVGGTDWIQLGRLLRDELGWNDYPDAPARFVTRRVRAG